jgi:hypothetical protein
VYDATLNLLEPSSITSTANGTAKFLGRNRSFLAELRVGGDVTGTNPTLDVTVEQSADLSTWTEIAEFSQVIDEMVGYVDASPVSVRPEVPGEAALTRTFSTTQDYVRAVVTVGGTATPTFPLTSVKVLPLDVAHRLSGV